MKKSLHILLTELIDYAGLFPPAALDLPQAFRNYDSYKVGGDAWALGRFVISAARFSDLGGTIETIATHRDTGPWRFSLVLNNDPIHHFEGVQAFHRLFGRYGFVIDTVEFKAAQPAAIDDVVRRLPPHIAAYVEIPIGDDPQRLIDAIGAGGARAKVRTGGVTPDAFPRPDDLLRFLGCCIEARVPFKATAGLHHPVRDRYRLTYDVDSPSATMYGFLNVFLTAAFLLAGLKPDLALPILTESDPNAFRFDDGVQWRDHRLDLDHLATARQLAISFGSCSFEEPLAALRALGLLASDE